MTTWTPPRLWHWVPTPLMVVFGLLVASYVIAMAWLLQLPYDIAGGVVVAHVLALITLPLLTRNTKNQYDRRLSNIVIAGLTFKFVGTLARFAVVFSLYGSGDAFVYDRLGRDIATAFRSGDFTLAGQQLTGTGFIEVFTGLVYTITGPTRLGGFLVYSWLGFWGLYLFYRAFRCAFPLGDHRLYAILVFFLPSMAFWPSSIGKEAWMTLALGMTAYGAALILNKQGRGVPWLLLGLIGSAVVRPHVTATIVVGLGVAYLLNSVRRTSFGAPFAKLAGFLVLLGVFAIVLSTVQERFNLDEGQGVVDVFEKTQERTSQDGSEFTAVGARSPLDLPNAAFSVLFRPLPYEARNVQSLLASLEGAFLLFLFVKYRRRLVNFIPRRRGPFLAFAATYSWLFIIAFSNLGNFGILARQRVQLFPFVLVLLAVDRRKVGLVDTKAERSSALAMPAPRRRRPLEPAVPAG